MASWPWLDLPRDLLNSIDELLDSYADFVRLRAVCASWRSALPNYPTQPPTPWLMLPPPPFGEENDNRLFFSPVDWKTYELNLPDIRHKICDGSFNGWLITRDWSSGARYLFNPLTRVQIDLPFVNDVVAYDPKDDEVDGYVATYCKYGTLCLYKCGHKERTAITVVGNAALYEKKFYVVWEERIIIFDVNSLTSFVNFPEKIANKIDEAYLISCDLGLLLIGLIRYRNRGSQITRKFEVYRVETNLHKLVKINSLGDYILFVGFYTSFAIPSRSGGLEGNCIYYIAEEFDQQRGMKRYVFGVFNMQDGQTSEGKDCQGRDRLLSHLPDSWKRPIWVVP